MQWKSFNYSFIYLLIYLFLKKKKKLISWIKNFVYICFWSVTTNQPSNNKTTALKIIMPAATCWYYRYTLLLLHKIFFFSKRCTKILMILICKKILVKYEYLFWNWEVHVSFNYILNNNTTDKIRKKVQFRETTLFPSKA